MSASAELLVALVMIAGVVGVVVPVLPGLLLIWAAGLVWVWQDGGGVARVAVGVLLTVLLVAGTVAKYVLPARTATSAGAPRSTLALGALGAVVGFLVIPVAGALIGGVGAVFLTEAARLRHLRGAGRSTWGVLRAIGLGMVVELGTAMAMFGSWLLAVALI